MRWLVDEAYPDAQVIRVVLDNLNTHTPASLYAAFPAPEARRLAKKLEFHFTPKHGRWLNVAESEFAVLATQCLDRRLPDLATVAREVAAWETAPQPRTADDQMALHHRPGPPQAQASLSTPGVITVAPD